MEDLSNIYKSNSNTPSVNLEFAEIESLEPLMPLLSKLKRMSELLLFGNRLESLPADMSSLRCLKRLDISNNLFPSVQSLLPALKSIPLLEDLHLTLQSEEDEQMLLDNLSLSLLNGVEVEGQIIQTEMKDSIDYQQNGHQLTQEDLEAVAIMYDEIRELWKSNSPGHDQRLAEEFDKHVKQTMGDLSVTLADTQPAFLVHSHMLRAKRDLFMICQGKATELVARTHPKLASVLAGANSQVNLLFVEMEKILHEIHPKYKQKVRALKEDLKKAMKETADVLEAAEQIENESALHNKEKEEIRNGFQRDIEELTKEVDYLREENKKYLDMIIRNSKQSAEQALSGKTVDYDRGYSANSTKQYLTSTLLSKTLTLKQTKDVIEELYLSKSKFDQKCSENQQPRETMEQHMYTYLNQKYGLKSLVIEWAAAVIAAIKQYSQEDSDVAVLGKILKNECDEDFRFVLVQVKETVVELIRMHLKAKHPLKSNADITTMLQEKLNGYLVEEEWVDVVKYMYNENDSALIISLTYEVIQTKNYPVSPPKPKMTREEINKREKANRKKIAYGDFLKVLMDFQIRGHEKFLKKFIDLFRAVDGDTNGIINEKEFQELCASTDVKLVNQECARLLQVIDPYNHQQITFSDCVSLFSSVIYS